MQRECDAGGRFGTGGRVLRTTGADGRAVFVKHFGVEGAALGCRAHAWLSALLPLGIWSASPRAGARELMAREWRKNAEFHAAGILVPDLAPAGPAALAASDAGPDTERVLKGLKRDGDAAAHDALLVALVTSLAQIHAAGLCHGRPHPRDTAPTGDGRFVWFDFEEEPEAAMPLVDAQARDLWLLFLQVCHRAIDPKTPARALSAYRAQAPAAAPMRLGAHLHRLAWTLAPSRLLLRLHAGSDLLRSVAATSFLLVALVSDDAAQGAAGALAGALWSDGDPSPTP